MFEKSHSKIRNENLELFGLKSQDLLRLVFIFIPLFLLEKKLSENLGFDWSMKTISASINKMGFSFVNSELISVSVLVEEILIECEETIGEYFHSISN